MQDSADQRTSGSLRGPRNIREARLRDAVSRLQVLLVRDLVSQYEADEHNLNLHSDHRGWLPEDVLVSRALGVYGPYAAISSTERALVLGVLEDLRNQRFVDRLDVEPERCRAWRLRRQNEEIVEAALRFVDDHKWVPPIIDVDGVIQALTQLSANETHRALPEPHDDPS